MAIVIKEIILSDTIEKFMEKVNFNFDQLMLAGGGPIGPQGNIGPIGPIGPEGDPGNKWYVGCTGTTAAIGASLYMGDLFLQKGNCIGATYPLGEVLEFNEITQIFVSTGLNLRGPTGAQGATGTSTGWGVYPGSDSGPGTVYNGTLNEGTPGPTASFVLMKGDAIGATNTDAEHPFYSKDSLYLGGLQGMANQVQVYQKERLPKLFVSPKTILDASVFSSNAGTTGAGLAGSGISFIREPLKNGNLYSPINQYSYSNIFIDDEMNLNITNFSDYAQAITLDSSVTNDINLMSKIGVKLLGGHYQPTSANGLLEVSESLETPLYPDTTGFFPAGGPGFHLRSTGSLNTGTISLKDTNQLRIISERVSGNSNLVDVAYWANVTTLSPNNKYRIGIGANAKYRDITSQSNDMPFIGSGAFDGSAVEYIGLGNKPTGNKAPTLSTFNYSTKDFVLIGNPNTYNPSNNLGTLVDKSIDIAGQIRMRYGASSPGQVLITSDSIGTAEWSPATSLGGWSNDSNCSTKIIISTNNQRFASFIPDTGIGYTRVDIPSLSGTGETDMYFGAYSMTSGNETGQQGHIINKRYQDPQSNGVLAISTGLLKNCPTDIFGRQMQGSSTVTPRLQVGAYGEIVIGNLAKTDDSISELGVINNVAGVGGINNLATGLLIDTFKIYKSRTTTQTGNIPPYHKFNRANIHLINNNVGDDPVESGDLINPLIKFTPNDTTPTGNLLSGDEWGFDSTTAFEVLRTYGTTNAGPGNIRFLGVGKSTKTANPVNAGIGDALPKNTSTGRGQVREVGSHVMMISDVTAKNKYNEVGKAYDYYEVNDLGINIDSISATFFNSVSAKGTRRYVYNKFDLNPWGTAASGWNNLNNNYGRFRGGRSGLLAADVVPEGYQLVDGIEVFNGNVGPSPWQIPGSGNRANHLNAWISPSAGVRFSPMNLSTPSTDAQTGLAWIDFNIDMGLIMEASNEAESSYLYGYYGVVRSLGGNIVEPYNPMDSAYQNDKVESLSKSFKVKHIKIQLNSNELGITSFLDNLDYSTRRDPLTGTNFIYENDPDSYQDIRNNSEQITKGIFYTDWYVGQVKAMNNLTGKGLSTTNPFDQSGATGPEAGRDTETSGALPWSQLTDNSGNVFPFKSDPSNPIQSQVPNMNFSTLGTDVKWMGHESSSFANSNKNATFMWRIYTQYSNNSNSDPFGCVLELYIVPSTSNPSLNNFPAAGLFPLVQEQSWQTIAEYNDSLQNYTTYSKYGYQQSQGGFYPTIPLMLSQYNQEALAGGGELNLEALLTNAMRTPEFYASHGFSLSGQSIVKWNKAKNQW